MSYAAWRLPYYDRSTYWEWLTWEVSPEGGLPSFWIMRPDGTDQRLIDFAVAPIWNQPDSSSANATCPIPKIPRRTNSSAVTGLPGKITFSTQAQP